MITSDIVAVNSDEFGGFVLTYKDIGRANLYSKKVRIGRFGMSALGLADLFVSESFRKQGIGRQLLDWIVTFAFDVGYDVVLGFTEYENLDFYTHCNWLVYREKVQDKYPVLCAARACRIPNGELFVDGRIW